MDWSSQESELTSELLRDELCISTLCRSQSLPPIAKPSPNTKTLLAQIQGVLNTSLKGANTYRNETSPAGLA